MTGLELMTVIGQVIKGRREILNLPREELASRTDTALVLIRDLEDGNLSDIEISTLERLCEALNMTLHDLFAGRVK